MPLPIQATILRRHRADVEMLRDDATMLTEAQFAQRTAALARLFQARGLGQGSIVAAMLSNRVESVVVQFAAWRIGAAFMPINPAFTGDEARYQLADSGAAIVIVEPDGLTAAAASGVEILPVDMLPVWGEGAPVVPVEPDALALLVYTSGTTGRPKGVMLSHANIDAMVRSIHQALEIDARDRSLLVLPLFHVNALVVSVLAPLAAGGAVVVAPRFEVSRFWERVAASRATYFSGVPTIYILLAQAAGSAPAHALRFVICGAAPMPEAAITAFEARFGVPLIEGYGLTESTVGVTLNPLCGPRRPGTVGVAMPGVDLKIAGDDGAPLPPGMVGEVLVKGPMVMRGYLNRPAETGMTIIDGWLHSGDLGRIDEGGWLTLAGRRKDILIRGGENIYPVEIEHALMELDGVREAAVIGRADPIMGEVPLAFVVVDGARDAARAEALAAALAERLTRHKLPAEFRFIDALPRNPLGKIDKPALRMACGPAPTSQER